MDVRSPFVWHELVTTAQQASGEFFSALLGWTRAAVDAGSFGTYTLFRVDGHDVAGMMNPTADTRIRGSFWHASISVEDVNECARRAADRRLR